MSTRVCWILGFAAVFILTSVGGCSQPSDVDGPDFQLVEKRRFPDHPEAPLGVVEAIAATADGETFVVDRMTQAILRFDADGRFRAMLGRKGEGPGEFQRPFYIGVVGDTLWAIDERLQRLTLLDSEGVVLETRTPLEHVRLPEWLRSPTLVSYLHDGSILLVASRDRAFKQLELLQISSRRTGLVDLGPLDAMQRWWVIEFPNGGSSSGQHQPFGFHDLFAAWSAGSAVVVVERPEPETATRGNYHIRVIASGGHTGPSIRIEYLPDPLTDSDVDTMLDDWLQGTVAESFLESGLVSNPESLRRVAEKGLVLPEYHPPVMNDGLGIVDRSLLVSAEGAIWVRRWTRPGEPQHWDVIGLDGGKQMVQVPAGVVLHAIRGETAWGVIHDDLEVPTIVRYQTAPIGK